MAAGIQRNILLNSDNFDRLKTLEKRFNDQLIGQPEAMAQVTEMIQQIVNGFFCEGRPLSVMLFAGPSGVGKTETAKMIAEELGCPLYRYDMLKFQDDRVQSHFLGSPISCESKTIGLANTLKKSPCSVILFDEVEKAHRDITTLFFRLFDEGCLIDSIGNEISARHSIFIMTTTLGSEIFYQQQVQDINARLAIYFSRHFSIELMGRVGKIVVFNRLGKGSIEKITEKYFLDVISCIEKRKKLEVTWDGKVLPLLLCDESEMSMGARAVHKKINERLFNVLSKAFLEGQYQNGDSIHLSEIAPGQLGIARVLKRNEPFNGLADKAQPYFMNYCAPKL